MSKLVILNHSDPRGISPVLWAACATAVMPARPA
jgi:hypothetical protein